VARVLTASLVYFFFWRRPPERPIEFKGAGGGVRSSEARTIDEALGVRGDEEREALPAPLPKWSPLMVLRKRRFRSKYTPIKR
jgi:hypothetical protein